MAVLRATTRTHLLAPHMQFQSCPPPSFSTTNMNNNSNKTSTATINRQYVPPSPLFKIDEFKNRDVQSLFRKVVRRR